MRSPPSADLFPSGVEPFGHDLGPHCRCEPKQFLLPKGADVLVHKVLIVRRCFACCRDVDRDPWPYEGFLCVHCDDYSMAAAQRVPEVVP
jgi:hypothetical protein